MTNPGEESLKSGYKKSMEEEYKFRYRLDPAKAEEQKVYSDPLLELIRSQLEQLLNLVVLTHRGEDVKVDGFKPLNNPDRTYGIFSRQDDADEEDAP